MAVDLTASPSVKAPVHSRVPGLVSIVMPVFNGEALIREAIDSVLKQTYETWELIVVDDGSTDGTARVVKQYSDARIRYCYQENRGQPAALNTGLSLVEGDFVTTLDADDWLTADSLAGRVDYLESHPTIGVAYGDGIYRDEKGQAGQRFTELMPAGVSGSVFDTLIVSPFYGTGAAVLVRRAVLDQYQISYDEAIKWCQDWDLYIRLAAVTEFGFVNTVVINYRVHNNGMTQTMPSDERRLALHRLRQKVVSMPRFGDVVPEQKAAFFYDYLTRDLDGKVDLQSAVFARDAFKALPKPERARLMRLTANQYIARDENRGVVARWLRAALLLKPTDVKTMVVYLLVSVSPSAASNLVTRWQGMRGRPDESPFEQAALKGS